MSAPTTTTGIFVTPPPRPAPRGLPLLIAFEEDAPARNLAARVHKFRRGTFENMGGMAKDADRILVTSSERLLSQHLDELRSAHLRVIAIAESQFKDPRVDGVVYAYVFPSTPADLFERIVDNAVDHIHLLETRREINERLSFATREIQDLNQIGAALSAEHDTEKLLELILTKSREITSADAGSLYLVEELADAEQKKISTLDLERAGARKRLRFKLA